MNQIPTLTDHQSLAVGKIRKFLAGSDPCFILKGSAGTGKTTLIGQLIRELDTAQQPYALLAPTGRAARILGAKTRAEASTIHKVIYHLTDIDVFEGAASANDPGLRMTFPLKKSDPKNTLFIVDESSMVGDKESHGDLLQFGSGRLLADLIEYARLARPGRAEDALAKILFVGDPAQLSPVGETLSPALSTTYLRQTFGLECDECEITEVMRQQAGSGILDRATAVRNAIGAKAFNKLDLSANGDDIQAATVVEAITLVEQAIKAKSSSVLITHSNAQALDLNRAVRGRLWGKENQELQTGDVLLVNKNSVKTGLYNGDLVKTMSVAASPERKSVRIRGVEAPVDLVFWGVSVAYRNMDGQVIRVDCKILENLLDSPERDLPPLVQRALLVDFRLRNPGLKPKTTEFKLAIQQDEYFNALQVKYGYALTCHKAQGGEWETAAVNFGDGRGQRNEEFFRWTYTAVTRAKKNLVTINAPNFNEISDLIWGNTATSAPPNAPNLEPVTNDPDWNRLSFNRGQEKLFTCHLGLREAWEGAGIVVDELEHMNYRERYFLSREGNPAVVEYQYNGKGKVTTFSTVPGNVANPVVLADALRVMGDVLLQSTVTTTELTDPFLIAFRDRVRSVLDGSGICLLSATPMQYRLRILFAVDGHHRSIDFHYDSTQKLTLVEEVGGTGSSGGLLERLHQLLGGITK
ncbi:MAG: AAA family ATPase [Burkholderiaceae bacterium]|nr:AAA family ATPase [Burkholderiaceae bacterium]